MEEALRQVPSNLVKVVLFGPESTGKTTLAQELADHYNTLWVPEYAREYLQDKWDRVQRTCEAEDLLPIARGQIRLENELSARADRLLICDTDLLETKVYSEAYYLGYCDPELEKHALENQYDLYFLTYIDVPWEKDDLRDRPKQRREMFEYFKSSLEQNRRRFVILKGSREQRLQTAISHIDKLLTMSPFTDKDLAHLAEKGIGPEKAAAQIGIFQEGIAPVRLSKAAVVDDGIVRLGPAEQDRLKALYREALPKRTILKFTPASGAASRMFKALFGFLEGFDPDRDDLESYLARPEQAAVKQFRDQLPKFPFYEMISNRLGKDAAGPGRHLQAFVREMLSEEGLNYGFYPKGMLPFHKYGNTLTTPFEEHLWEGAAYAATQGLSRLHFTISEAHHPLFTREQERVRDRVEAETGCRFELSYSYQKGSTDTLAVTPDNEPFRDNQGRLLFRPGGHGALIENLNEQDADLIFIKNIDNVAIRSNLATVAGWKEVLGGYLLELQETAYRFTRMLEEGTLDHDLLVRIGRFLESRLNTRLPDTYSGLSLDDQVAVLRDKLARPIRVCGMVKNEGEPGGGPFWIKDASGNESLQIVESAQADLENEGQRAIFAGATHFNPVDLVCGVRDAFGNKYNLLNFVDSRQGFITEKTFEGRPLKALELPGLWNGAMAFWNTVFVEVPVSTFNPVKTVNDLLKPAHQASRAG